LAREALLRAGAQWWVCRSANAAMWALAESGIRFRAFTNGEGGLEHWQPPRLPEWEVPKRNPHERRPRAPEWKPNAAMAEIAELRGVSRSQSVAAICLGPKAEIAIHRLK
jgi:hypothetical protein